MFYNCYHTYYIMVFILHLQTIQIKSPLTTQFPDKSSNITPQKAFCSCFTYSGTFRLTEHSWCLLFLNRPLLVLRRNKAKYEDDLHFTSVVYMKKTRILRQKNNNNIFMLNIVATCKEISLVLQSKLNIIV